MHRAFDVGVEEAAAGRSLFGEPRKPARTSINLHNSPGSLVKQEAITNRTCLQNCDLIACLQVHDRVAAQLDC